MKILEKIKKSLSMFALFALALQALLMGATPVIAAATLNVCSSCTYPTIQAAVNAASSGDTINVAAGTYNEQVNITKSINLRGPNYQVNPNTGTRGAEAILSTGPNAFSTGAGNTDVIIDGFKFDGVSPMTDGYASNPRTSDVTFSNNVVVNANSIYTGTSGSWENLVISNNKFQDVNGDVKASAMQLFNLLTATITNNTFTSINYAAILLEGIPTSTVSGNVINTTGWQAIQLAGVMGDATVENNIITGANSTAKEADRGAIRLYGSAFTGAVLIQNNTISGGYNGITVKDGQNITGKNITVTRNSITGLTSGNAVYNGATTGTLNAKGNWWGSASGPGSVGPGSGGTVSAKVNYKPWCTDNACTTFSSAIAITSPTLNQAINGRTVNIEGTATDVYFNYYHCYVTNANGEVGIRDSQCVTAWSAGSLFHSAFAATATGTTAGHLGTVTLPNNLPDGNFVVHLIAYDKAGDSQEATQPFMLDNTAPVQPIFISPVNNLFTKTNFVNLTWNNGDDSGLSQSGVKGYIIRYTFVPMDGGSTVEWTSGIINNGNPKTHGGTYGHGQGMYTIYVSTVDNAGNVSEESDPLVLSYDATAPVAAITTPTVAAVSGHTLNIEGTATDANFNYYYCYVTNANGEVGIRDSQCVTAWSAGSLFHSAFAATATGTTAGHLGTVDLTGLSSGAYQVHLVAYDKAGNSTDATPVSFTLDNTKPKITLTGSDSILLNVGETYKEPGYTIDDGSIVNVISDVNTTIAGIYTVTYTATDEAGNTSKVSRTISVVVDKTAPALVSGLVATPGNGSVVLNWTNPTDTDFAGVNIYRGTTAGVFDLTPINVALVTGGLYTDSGLTNGVTYYYEFKSVDSLGNPSTGTGVSATPVAPVIVAPLVVTQTPAAPVQPEEQAVQGAQTSNVQAPAGESNDQAVKGSDDSNETVDVSSSLLGEKVLGIKLWIWLLLVILAAFGSYYYLVYKRRRK